MQKSESGCLIQWVGSNLGFLPNATYCPKFQYILVWVLFPENACEHLECCKSSVGVFSLLL